MNQENNEQRIVGRYGFRVNLHEKPSDAIIRIGFLEKIGIDFSISGKRMIVGSLATASFVILFGIYLFSNKTRLGFIIIPSLLITIGFLLFLGQNIFLNKNNVSFFQTSKTIFKQFFSNLMIKKGKKGMMRDLGIYVTRDGTLKFNNGDLGKIYLIDGSTSSTAFPDEVMAQEDKAQIYHNGRLRTTTEIKITSSQRQNAEKQIDNLKRQLKKAKNKASHDVASMQKTFVDNSINGVKMTIVQYLIIREHSELSLNEYTERLMRSVENGLYYDLTPLTQKESENILTDIVNFR